jgi:hypothetical protein
MCATTLLVYVPGVAGMVTWYASAFVVPAATVEHSGPGQRLSGTRRIGDG